MFIVTDQEGNVKKYRSLSKKTLCDVTIECTTDATVNNAVLNRCKIHSKHDITFNRCHINHCNLSYVAVFFVETVSYATHYDNVTFKNVQHSSIACGGIYNSELREIRAHFIGVDFHKIVLRGICHDIYLSRCRGMVSASGLGNSDRTAYCYNSPDGPMVALGCFRGTRKFAAYTIATKYNGSPSGKLYSKAVNMLFDLLEDQ